MNRDHSSNRSSDFLYKKNEPNYWAHCSSIYLN